MKISLFLESKTAIMSNVKDLIGVNTFERPMNSTNPGFFGGLPADAMHDVLEGVLQYSVKELI